MGDAGFCLYLLEIAFSTMSKANHIINKGELKENYNNFQDSKSIFMISDFNILPTMLLRQLNFGVFSV